MSLESGRPRVTYELPGKRRNVFNNRKTDAPLLVLCQFDDGRDQMFGQLVQANDLSNLQRKRSYKLGEAYLIQLTNDVQTNVGYIVFQ